MCWTVSMRHTQKRFPSFTPSRLVEHLLLLFVGNYSRFLECITDKVKREYSCLLCTSYSKGERPTINNKCSIMNSVIYWNMMRRKHNEYFKTGLRHKTQMY